jgi:pimeloyl-ACP methyl ester carboxylesterase
MRYDRRGFGKSLPVEGQYTNMSDLIAVLDGLHLDQPLTMIGCSMGGMLALDFGISYPERTKALVMVGSAPAGLDLDVPFDPREEEAEAANKAGDYDRQTELEAGIFFDGMGRTPQQVNQEMRRLFLEMDRLAHSHEARQLGERLPSSNFEAVNRLDEVKFPVLMVVGEHDEPYILQAADYMVEHVPSARKVVFKDAAHMVNMDHPAQFESAVRAFLNGKAS